MVTYYWLHCFRTQPFRELQYYWNVKLMLKYSFILSLKNEPCFSGVISFKYIYCCISFNPQIFRSYPLFLPRYSYYSNIRWPFNISLRVFGWLCRWICVQKSLRVASVEPLRGMTGTLSHRDIISMKIVSKNLKNIISFLLSLFCYIAVNDQLKNRNIYIKKQ